MPRRRPHLSRVCEYVAAVGPRKGHGICREGVWPIRGVRQVQSWRRICCVNIFLLSFIAPSKRARCSAVSSQANEVGEVADLHLNLFKRADDKAGNASRVVGVHLCLDVPSCVRVRAEFIVELLGILRYS